MKNFILIPVWSVFAVVMGCNEGKSPGQTSTLKAEAKPAWQLGVGTYTFNRFTFFEALEKIDSCGLKYVEIFPEHVVGGGVEGNMDYHMDASKQKRILKEVSGKGLTLIAYGVVTPKGEEEWRRLFGFAKAMGIQTVTSEPDEKDLPFISKLCDEYQINMAIHNHPYPKHYWHPDSVLTAIRGRSKRIGACADIGHWVRSGLDPVECLQKLEGHVLHLHMKDLEYREGKDDGEENRDTHWGTGVANISGVMRELNRQHFKGMIAAEYERNWDNNLSDVMASVQYFRSVEKQIKGE